MIKNNRHNLTQDQKEKIIKFLMIYDKLESTILNEIFYYFYIEKKTLTIIKASIILEIYPKYLYRQVNKLNKIIEIIKNFIF